MKPGDKFLVMFEVKRLAKQLFARFNWWISPVFCRLFHRRHIRPMPYPILARAYERSWYCHKCFEIKYVSLADTKLSG